MLAMAVGGFGIGTGEFVIMGLLPEVAKGLQVNIAQAGRAISAYAAGVMVGAPVLAVLTAKWQRRWLLVAMMLAYALGNFASALAPGYPSLIALRFVAGLPHGTYFGAAALVAAALAPPGRRATSVALVMTGLTAATVVGVRAAFALVGCNALAAAWLIQRHVPAQSAPAQGSVLDELSALRLPQVWLTLGVAAIGFGGLFAVFSYIKPTLLHVSHMPQSWVPLTLSLFGMGMVAGNLAGARLADRWLMPSIAGVLVWALAVMALFYWAALWPVTAAAGLFLVGSIGAQGVGTKMRLMDVAGKARPLRQAGAGVPPAGWARRWRWAAWACSRPACGRRGAKACAPENLFMAWPRQEREAKRSRLGTASRQHDTISLFYS